jgi:hypothetical protein
MSKFASVAPQTLANFEIGTVAEIAHLDRRGACKALDWAGNLRHGFTRRILNSLADAVKLRRGFARLAPFNSAAPETGTAMKCQP